MRTLAPLTLLSTLTSASLLPTTRSDPTSSSSNPLPLVIWHGLGDNYAAEGLADVAALAEEVNPGTFVYLIRLDEDPSSDKSATFFGNLTEQLSSVCEQLAAHPILSTAPAINALGFSQGGQFLRGYVERCNNPPVRNLVTMGSQHNGIADFQTCGATDWLCKGAMALLRYNTWSAFVQRQLVPAQYFRSVDEETGVPTEEYLEHSNFIADINNERALKNQVYKQNLVGLKRFVLYMFAEDTVVVPKETSWFDDVKNLTSGEVTKLKDRDLYKEDWIGLRELDERGALVFKKVPGQHMQIAEEDLRSIYQEYFSLQKGDPKFAMPELAQEVIEL